MIALILLIGFSRIYLRVHYTSDVISGFIIGFIWLLISLFVIGRAEQYSQDTALTEAGFSNAFVWISLVSAA